jgi:hypothetical protein
VTTFDKREEAFEKKFTIDEELKFKSIARRNKLLGLWVAEKLGKTGTDADAYAKEVVAAGIDGGDASIIRKAMADLAAKGSAISETEFSAKMTELLAVAIVQVKAGV